MKIQVVLERFGRSRVSFDGIPIVARILQGGRMGEDLVAKLKPTTIELAKSHAESEIVRRFNQSVEIEWIDRTWDAGTDG